jgi:glycosyltransferase involved in cell wall biosynthesis
MQKYVIIAPCYNEENVIGKFLQELEEILAKTGYAFTVLIVDDCSTDKSVERLKAFSFKSNAYQLEVIRLKYNVGHQGAIRQGLRYAAGIPALGYIVMDSDGEDDPEAIVQLLNGKPSDIKFVTRGKRRESLSFKAGYFFYKILFKIISGNQINFGNYTFISRRVLDSIHLQNFDHYSAFLSKQKYNKEFLKFDRRKRIDGHSKMNVNSLVIHGLKSLLEYSEQLLFFFIRVLMVFFLALMAYGGYVFYCYFISRKAILGWTSTIGIGLINSILITAGIIVLGLLIVSNKNRKNYQNDIFFKE